MVIMNLTAKTTLKYQCLTVTICSIILEQWEPNFNRIRKPGNAAMFMINNVIGAFNPVNFSESEQFDKK
jgi:hypothetical protein